MHRRVIAQVLMCAFAASLLPGNPAVAVIKVDLPVAKIYGNSTTVASGILSTAKPADKTFEATFRTVYKGELAQAVRFVVDGPADLPAGLTVDMPIVLFIPPNNGPAVVHMADQWLLAQKTADATQWRIVGRHGIAKSFPGRTAALIQIVAGLKAKGWTTLRDSVSHEAFLEGSTLLADLKFRPSSLAAADLNRDGQLDLVVGTAGGVRVFLRTADGYSDATESSGLTGLAAYIATADVDGDGRTDVLLGRVLWRNDGARFLRDAEPLGLPPESEWLAATLAEATGDKLPDAVVLLKSGKLLTAANPGARGKAWPLATRTLWQDEPAPIAAVFSSQWGDNRELHLMAVRPTGITRYAAGSTQTPPADFQRLTGVGFDIYKDFGAAPQTILMALAIDYDGNGAQDLFVVTDTGGIVLANRNFGTFLINAWAPKVFHATPEKPLKWANPFPFRLTPGTVVAPGRAAKPGSGRRNLLLITEEGKVYELANSHA